MLVITNYARKGGPDKWAPTPSRPERVFELHPRDRDPGSSVYFLRRDDDGTVSVADSADTAAQPCYDARGVTRMYDHLTAVSTAMNQLGWSNYANDHEDGNGQFEQKLTFAEALTTTDRRARPAISPVTRPLRPT